MFLFLVQSRQPARQATTVGGAAARTGLNEKEKKTVYALGGLVQKANSDDIHDSCSATLCM